ncbi:hypothetical protein ANCDUO_24427 [Ancylostoma duodenale]|uniref:Uncharacterized protein n=1 Tax=Ancylostoma duodenale TaxID=51022 RepID=A0A0C2C7A8_9BILA|nr:hypothetical protein ANCDUO_24427 [Ancylostoma duodenale]
MIRGGHRMFAGVRGEFPDFSTYSSTAAANATKTSADEKLSCKMSKLNKV